MAFQVTWSGWLITYKRVNDLAHVKGMQLQLLQDSWKGVCDLCSEQNKSTAKSRIDRRTRTSVTVVLNPSDQHHQQHSQHNMRMQGWKRISQILLPIWDLIETITSCRPSCLPKTQEDSMFS